MLSFDYLVFYIVVNSTNNNKSEIRRHNTNFSPSAIAVGRLHPDKSVFRIALCALAFTHPKGIKNIHF
jgi:hypothetical protein